MMRRFAYLGTPAVLVAIAFTLLAAQDAEQATRTGQEIQRWEYRILVVTDPEGDDDEKVKAVEAQLNELGKNGWRYRESLALGRAMVFERPWHPPVAGPSESGPRP